MKEQLTSFIIIFLLSHVKANAATKGSLLLLMVENKNATFIPVDRSVKRQQASPRGRLRALSTTEDLDLDPDIPHLICVIAPR